MDILYILLRVWIGFATSAIIFAHVIAGTISPNLKYIPPSISALKSSAPRIGTTTITVATTTPKSTTKTARVAKRINAATSTSAAVQAPPTPSISIESANALARQSLVNILCTTKYGGPSATISGSGVIVDSRGVVLTNAHVGQYFLLRNYLSPDSVVCTVRTGSPAQSMYTAKLLYLPPEWIAANASQIKEQHGVGTGENDYAFLLITGTVNANSSLPSSFAALPIALQEPFEETPVLLAAYPAGFFDGAAIQNSLYVSTVPSTVQHLYTFNDTTHVDLLAVGGTIISQSGSSGGAVTLLQDGKLVGLIATATTEGETSGRLLFAITLAHIDRSLRAASQGGIGTLLSQDITKASADFNNNIAPGLTDQLAKYLGQ